MVIVYEVYITDSDGTTDTIALVECPFVAGEMAREHGGNFTAWMRKDGRATQVEREEAMAHASEHA